MAIFAGSMRRWGSFWSEEQALTKPLKFLSSTERDGTLGSTIGMITVRFFRSTSSSKRLLWCHTRVKRSCSGVDAPSLKPSNTPRSEKVLRKARASVASSTGSIRVNFERPPLSGCARLLKVQAFLNRPASPEAPSLERMEPWEICRRDIQLFPPRLFLRRCRQAEIGVEVSDDQIHFLRRNLSALPYHDLDLGAPIGKAEPVGRC